MTIHIAMRFSFTDFLSNRRLSSKHNSQQSDKHTAVAVFHGETAMRKNAGCWMLDAGCWSAAFDAKLKDSED